MTLDDLDKAQDRLNDAMHYRRDPEEESISSSSTCGPSYSVSPVYNERERERIKAEQAKTVQKSRPEKSTARRKVVAKIPDHNSQEFNTHYSVINGFWYNKRVIINIDFDKKTYSRNINGTILTKDLALISTHQDYFHQVHFIIKADETLIEVDVITREVILLAKQGYNSLRFTRMTKETTIHENI